MTYRWMCLFLGVAMFAAAHAADSSAPQPQPLAPSSATAAGSGKPLAAPRVLAPTLSETRVVRRADGSLVVHCVDQPNPPARALLERVRSAQGAPQP